VSFVIYPDSEGRWHWKIATEAGLDVESPESFDSAGDARAAADAIREETAQSSLEIHAGSSPAHEPDPEPEAAGAASDESSPEPAWSESGGDLTAGDPAIWSSEPDFPDDLEPPGTVYGSSDG
jgi:hypothetical protein